MATIPNNLTDDQREERRIYLRMNKQNWFKYRAARGVPWIDPLSIPTIIVEMKVHEKDKLRSDQGKTPPTRA